LSDHLLLLWSRSIMQINLLRIELGIFRLGLDFLYHRNHSNSLPIVFLDIDINTLFLFLLYMLVEYVFKIIGV
jgi:hypothetical protein